MNKIESKRFFDDLSKIKVKCECSHIMLFPSYGSDIKICSHCGHKVYRNDKVKFTNMLSSAIKVINR